MLVYHEYFDLFLFQLHTSHIFKIMLYAEGQQFYIFIERFHDLNISKDFSGFYTWGGRYLFIVVLNANLQSYSQDFFFKRSEWR